MQGFRFPKRIVITGAAGMIGSGIVRHLNDSGYTDLTLVDDLKRSEKWKNLIGKRFLNLISRHSLMHYLKDHSSEIDAIIHMGACSDTEELDGDYLLENNYRYSVRLAEWALSHNKRFIYASSAATYGDGSLGFSDDEDQIEELRPLNLYAFSKQLFDLWMRREGGLKRAVGLKYFNVFGPNEGHKGHMASLLYKMMQQVRAGEEVKLYQSNDARFAHGDQCRDFIYLKDAVRMTCSFLTSPAAGLYNIGSGTAIPWNQIAHLFFHALSEPPRIRYIEFPQKLARCYQNYTCADMRKFSKIFSMQMTSLEEAIFEYVRNYLAYNSQW